MPEEGLENARASLLVSTFCVVGDAGVDLAEVLGSLLMPS